MADLQDWRARFEAFVARKECEAAGATLSPLTTEIDDGRSLVSIGNEWSHAVFDGAFYLSPLPSDEVAGGGLVFVQSRDGNTGAADPETLGGGPTDKHLIYEGLSRVAADGVLAGAGTVRGGDVVFSVWHPQMIALRASLGLPRHPAQVVATRRGLPFDTTLLYNVPELRVIVLTVASGIDAMAEEFEKRPWITAVRMANSNDLTSAFRLLRTAGLGRVSAIGGRTLAAALLDAGLIQDVYLTTAARPGGEPNTPLYPEPLSTRTIVRKHGTGPERGIMFEHLTPHQGGHGGHRD